ncbi:MAG: hypothetical protein AAB289_03795, partial [Chloroflexota bacterium]
MNNRKPFIVGGAVVVLIAVILVQVVSASRNAPILPAPQNSAPAALPVAPPASPLPSQSPAGG